MQFRAFCLLAVILFVTTARAQSTAFTYQGSLKNSGQAASGPYDMRFRLFDAVTGGAQVGATVCMDNVSVIDGIFSLQLDFGPQFNSPAGRHLEISVRPEVGQPCSDSSAYVTLSPRQPLTAAPLASHAKSSFALDAADGSPVNAVFVDNAGKVGIGTTAPTHSVHVATNGPTIALQDTSAASQQAGYVSYRDNANIERAWVGYGTPGSPDFSIVNARPGGNIYVTPVAGDDVVLCGSGGRVGIGTSTPTSTLDVHGDVRTTGRYYGGTMVQRYKSIHGSSFLPSQENVNANPETVRYADGIVGRRVTDGLCTKNYYYVPIELPDGCVVTHVQFSLIDNSACGTYGEMYRMNMFTGQLNVMASFPFSDVNGATVRVITSSNISTATIDNFLYAYVLRVHMSGLPRETGNAMRILAARVGYQTNTPYP